MSNVPELVTAAAAAVLLTEFGQVDEHGQPIDTKYYVHPHIVSIASDEPALIRYLEDIYSSGAASVEMSETPRSSAFRSLKSTPDVPAETRKIADELCARMQSTSARAGIVFGFRLKLRDGSDAFGVIKADIEDSQRFHLKLGQDQWTIDEVNELLPSPRDKYAKFVISPQPQGAGAAGIRDRQAQNNSAAAYFLGALGATMPKTEGTKLAVAQSALRAGHEPDVIREALSSLEEDIAPREFIEHQLSNIEDRDIDALEGTEEQPMPVIRASEPLVTEWYLREPYFSLKADASVDVKVEGDTITVTLPEGHSEIVERFIKKR